MIRGIRGAITVKENEELEIVAATEKLLRQIIKENQIAAEDVASIFISVTEDIFATFPAKAVRLIEGWKYVPVIDMKEMSVPSALEKCIRIMLHVNTDKLQEEIIHVYLDGAEVLRPDLHTKRH